MKWLVSLLMLFTMTVEAQSVKTYIPEGARTYQDLILKETQEYWKDIPTLAYPFALIEHESCITLKHSKCFNPQSRLLTKREEGGGLGQLTRAYREDGSLRFDSLQEMKDKYKIELKELQWSNLYTRPDLQVRSLVLMSRDNFSKLYFIPNPYARLHFTDVAYNSGLRGTLNDRRACGLTKGCDPDLWFDNVETTCTRSKKAIYGNRSPCDILKNHPRDIFNHRLPKYERLMITTIP